MHQNSPDAVVIELGHCCAPAVGLPAVGERVS